MKLSELWKIYKSNKILEGYSGYTLKSYELQHNLFLRHQGDMFIKDITHDTIKSYLAKDVERLKPSSIFFRMKYFRSIFRHAMDEGYIMKNPAQRLINPEIPHRIPKAMNEEEIEMLRIACESPLENALIETIFASGCRIGEIHQANKSTVNIDNQSMTIIGKGDREREVYFGVRCAIWLKKYLKDRSDKEIALFVTERRFKTNCGQPRRMSKDQIRWVLKRVAKRADIDNLYPHKLRHSFAMHMLRKGAPIEVI